MIPLATSIIRLIAQRLAPVVVQFAVKQGLEAATDQDFRSLGEVTIEFLRRELNLEPEEASAQQVRRAAELAVENGQLRPQTVLNVEKQTMTEFQAFMSIGLTQCGSDQETFRDLVGLWNENKAEIKGMSQREVRETLICP